MKTRSKILISALLIVVFIIVCILVFFYATNNNNQPEYKEVELSRPKKLDFTVNEEQLNLVNPGVLTVAVSPPYAPFEYNKDGVLMGFDIEIAKAMADDLNLKVNFLQVPFTSLFNVVENGTRCDLALGGIQITEERKKQVNFSKAYFKDSTVVLGRADSDIDEDNVEQKAINGELTVCVVEGSTCDIWVRQTYPKCEVTVGQDFEECATKMLLGQADVILASAIEYNTNESISKVALKTIKSFDDVQEVGIAVPKNKTYLLEQVNKLIDARWDDEYIWELYTKYFN